MWNKSGLDYLDVHVINSIELNSNYLINLF